MAVADSRVLEATTAEPGTIPSMLGSIKALSVSDDVKTAILGGYAARLLSM